MTEWQIFGIGVVVGCWICVIGTMCLMWLVRKRIERKILQWESKLNKNNISNGGKYNETNIL